MMIDKRAEANEIQTHFEGVVEEIRECVKEVFAETVQNTRVSREGVEEFTVAKEIPVVAPFIGVAILV
jgi:hypothetical protein